MDPNLANAVSSIQAADVEMSELRAALATTQNTLVDVQGQLADALADDATDDATIAALEAEVARLQAIIDAGPNDPTDPPVLEGHVLGQSLETVPSNVETVPAIAAYFQPGDFGTGKTQKTWTTPTTDNTVEVLQEGVALGAKIFWISFKDGPEPGAAAQIDIFLASIPKDKGYTILVTYFHEHNGNIRKGQLTLAKYREGSKIVADLAHKHGCLFGPNHNGSNMRDGSSGPWGYWPSEWAKVEADVTLYDFWSCDGYAPEYQDPATLFAPTIEYAKSLGLPLLWRETASPVGSQQAAWATKARAWMLKNTNVALWWSSQVDSTKPNYRLTEASAKAWYNLP